jgi:putative ABC transport system ATP-binding protein
MIDLDQVTKTYTRADGTPVTALRGVSLTIAAGEMVAVRGPSGSGKSSLLNILGCLDTPTAGSYRLAGDEVSACGDRALSRLRCQRIGFVFQSFNLLPRTTAVENVELPMAYAGRPVDRARALALLDRVGLAGRAFHYATELSGGEQQRVAIARALINDPPLILADEPTGNLDSAAGGEVMALLHELHGEGRTVILVTHDDAIAAHARREVRLRDGLVESDRLLARRSERPGAEAAADSQPPPPMRPAGKPSQEPRPGMAGRR